MGKSCLASAGNGEKRGGFYENIWVALCGGQGESVQKKYAFCGAYCMIYWCEASEN